MPWFLSFSVKGWRGKNLFFQFSLFPNVFPQRSLQVPNGFQKCSPSSQRVPPDVLHVSTSLLAHTLRHFHLTYVGPRGRTTHIKTEPPLSRNLHSFFLFGQQWANQIGFGPEFWHPSSMRANVAEAPPMDNFGFKPVRTAGTHVFIDSRLVCKPILQAK